MASPASFDSLGLNVDRSNEQLSRSRRGAIYRSVELLGQGRRGSVFLCDNLCHESNGQPERVALRFIPRQASNASNTNLNSEISSHWLLSTHPHVLNFYTVLLTPSFLVVVMEFCAGGTLASYITSLITHTSLHRRSSIASTLTGCNTHTDASMASDYSHSGRHSNNSDLPEQKRLSIVRKLFQQLITLLEYVQHCGMPLGEFQPECFMVAFDDVACEPSLRLSHFGHLHTEHPIQQEYTKLRAAPREDPDEPFCPADLLHWTRTHAKAHLAPPPTLDPTRNPLDYKDSSRSRPESPDGASASSASHHSSQSFQSRSEAVCRSQEEEREKGASRMLDIACAGSILFYMLHGCEPFPADGEEKIKSWRSKDTSGITWPSRNASSTEAGELISWMLQPIGERCMLEDVKQDRFFCNHLPRCLRKMNEKVCEEMLSVKAHTAFLEDVRDLVYVSRKPSIR